MRLRTVAIGTVGLLVGMMIAANNAQTSDLYIEDWIFYACFYGGVPFLIAFAIERRARRRQNPNGRAGWYPDPSGRFEARYFDGAQWTANVSVGQQMMADVGQPAGVTDG